MHVRPAWLFPAFALAVAGCDDDLPARRPSVVQDSLWKLAPEGARGGIVVSPYALGKAEDGFAALRVFLDKAGPELGPVGELLDDALGPLGGRKATLASAAFTRDKGGALFIVQDGFVAVAPVTDRDAFLKLRNGTKSTTPDGPDRIGTGACKQVQAHYVCATSEALLATVGKGTLAAELAKVGARGDIEVVGVDSPLGLGASVAAAIQVERGQVVVRGIVTKPPEDLVTKLGPAMRPRTQIGRSAGFGVFDLRPQLEGVPAIPLVDGVTAADLVKSFAGPLTVSVPAGTGSLDVELPLSDPAPATKVLAKCELPQLGQLQPKLVNGVCHLHIIEVDLDAWVDGTTLHLGKKTGAAAPIAMPLTGVASELATGQWSFVFWGRGTMFAAPPADQPKPDLPPQIDPRQLAPVRAFSLVNEAGLGARIEKTKDGPVLRFVGIVRLAFANPDPVVAKLVDLTALEAIAGTADKKAKPIADAHRGTLFATDFAAGQTGMLMPTTIISISLNRVIPALMQLRGGGPAAPAEVPTDAAPIGERTKLIVEGYAMQVYPAWVAKNPGKTCPTMVELAKFVSDDAITDDEWGKPLVLQCGKDLPAGAKDIAITSGGPDGQLGTFDDIKSY